MVHGPPFYLSHVIFLFYLYGYFLIIKLILLFLFSCGKRLWLKLYIIIFTGKYIFYLSVLYTFDQELYFSFQIICILIDIFMKNIAQNMIHLVILFI